MDGRERERESFSRYSSFYSLTDQNKCLYGRRLTDLFELIGEETTALTWADVMKDTKRMTKKDLELLPISVSSLLWK